MEFVSGNFEFHNSSMLLVPCLNLENFFSSLVFSRCNSGALERVGTTDLFKLEHFFVGYVWKS